MNDARINAVQEVKDSTTESAYLNRKEDESPRMTERVRQDKQEGVAVEMGECDILDKA